jgi:hypothetical protein
MSKSARANPINNLVEEEIHYNTLIVLHLKLVYRLSFKNAFPATENYPHSLYQEIIIPPPKIA